MGEQDLAMTTYEYVERFLSEKTLFPAQEPKFLKCGELDELISIIQHHRDCAWTNWRGISERVMSIYMYRLDEELRWLKTLRNSKSRKKKYT